MNEAASIGTRPRTFQDLIFALQSYWSEQGCVILQPYDMEVGAGTFHTATFLRAIGPEPWSAAYVQPSRRPTDGRYGDNPFRLQHYYQFQVVIKPSPPDILRAVPRESLRALGFDPLDPRHPLRRGQLGVADARRLGPGLGSLAQRHGDHAVHLLPAGRRPRLPAGDGRDHLRARAPRDVHPGQGEHLRHRLDRGPARHASPTATCSTRTRWSSPPTTSRRPTPRCCSRQFDEHERRVPARCSRTGWRCPPTSRWSRPRTRSICSMRARAISVTERQRYILRVRTLARGVAEAYSPSREALGFPLLQAPRPARRHRERGRAARDLLFETAAPRSCRRRRCPTLERALADGIAARPRARRASRTAPSNRFATPRRLAVRVRRLAGRAAGPADPPPRSRRCAQPSMPPARRRARRSPSPTSCGVELDRARARARREGRWILSFAAPARRRDRGAAAGHRSCRRSPRCRSRSACAGAAREAEFVRPVHWVRAAVRRRVGRRRDARYAAGRDHARPPLPSRRAR